MTIQTIEDMQVTKFAEKVIDENREMLIKDLANHINEGIKIGQTQFEKGQNMSLDESKQRLFANFFNQIRYKY